LIHFVTQGVNNEKAISPLYHQKKWRLLPDLTVESHPGINKPVPSHNF